MFIASLVAIIFEAKPVFKTKLVGFNILWGQLLSITTFTLTFFLNVSYGLWRKCYELSRRLQGRLNDLSLTMAAHADRMTPSNPDEYGTYTPGARQILELMARYVRVFNILTYASFTRSHRPILTPTGMRRLVERGVLTPTERQILVDGDVPATQRHNNILLWIVRVFIESREAGHIKGGSGFEQQFMEKVHVIRAQYGAIGDELQGRMPLAYAHIVQVLVDVILLMYPFMAFTSSKMSPWLGIFSTGLLTIFYQGLFDLAKQFLDPYDNENYGQGDDPLCVDTLVAETNAGSVRWLRGVAEVPFNKDKLKEGEMKEYLLPLRGYSVEKLMEMEEEERLERERKEEEDRQKQELLEKQRIEEEKALLAEALEEEERLKHKNSTLINELEKNPLLNTSASASSLFNSSIVSNSTIAFTSLDMKPDNDVISQSNKTNGIEILKTQIKPSIKKSDNAEREFKPAFKKPQKEDKTAFITSNQINPASTLLKEETEKVNKKLEISPKKEEKKKPILIEEFDEEEFFFDQITAGLEDFDWYEQIGPDGNEMRLSEMLADEAWEESLYEDENIATNETLKYEQATEQAKDMIQAVKEEFLETAAILNAAPGASSELETKGKSSSERNSNTDKKDVSKVSVPKARKDVNDNSQKMQYDQTKLDSLSQLWGAGPKDLDGIVDKDMNETALPLDSLRMESFSQLWSDSSMRPVTPSRAPESSTDAGEIMSDNIKQLWGESPAENSFIGEDVDDSDLVFPDMSFDGLEWFNEKDDDGNEVRLSEILADEEWEEETEIEPPTVETFEDFSKKAIEQIEAYEEELSETEAILNSPPGFQSLGEEFEEDEEDEKSEKVVQDNDAYSLESPGVAIEDIAEEECISDAILNASPGSQSLDVEQLCKEEPCDEPSITDTNDENGEITDESLNVFEMDIKLENEGKLRSRKSGVEEDLPSGDDEFIIRADNQMQKNPQSGLDPTDNEDSGIIQDIFNITESKEKSDDVSDDDS